MGRLRGCAAQIAKRGYSVKWNTEGLCWTIFHGKAPRRFGVYDGIFNAYSIRELAVWLWGYEEGRAAYLKTTTLTPVYMEATRKMMQLYKKGRRGVGV